MYADGVISSAEAARITAFLPGIGFTIVPGGADVEGADDSTSALRRDSGIYTLLGH
jgi:hypothetical protein